MSLNQKQLNAIDLLVVGNSITDTSKSIKTSRETVSRWFNHDADFIAELNQRRHDVWHSFEDRLRSLLPKAIDVLESHLDDGDKQTALAIIKAIQLEPKGSTSAYKIELENGW